VLVAVVGGAVLERRHQIGPVGEPLRGAHLLVRPIVGLDVAAAITPTADAVPDHPGALVVAPGVPIEVKPELASGLVSCVPKADALLGLDALGLGEEAGLDVVARDVLGPRLVRGLGACDPGRDQRGERKEAGERQGREPDARAAERVARPIATSFVHAASVLG
jgi:hypothetical protein